MARSPAPWILDGIEDSQNAYRVLAHGGRLIMLVMDGEEGHGNARLVTASPETRWALERVHRGEMRPDDPYVVAALARSSEIE